MQLSTDVQMCTFVSRVNRITGQMEWDFREDDYDYKQEIARSSYADMLHDSERNQLYYEALKVAIERKRCEGQPVHVLDIGTGTGLLSMMAARLGADTVHACEAFTPMAECARKIISQNGFKDKIKVIPKRSTELEIGIDMPERANILVTEVFDTELIGEGAVGTFTHAHRELLQADCIVVPSVGNMYVQVVSSDLVRHWNHIDDFVIDKDTRITSPSSISDCGGAPSLHDLQLDQLPMDTFTELTKPLRVFRFDFTGKTTLPCDETSVVNVQAIADGKVDAVFMWWDLEMDPDGEIILSCAPRWAHPTPSDMQWRDHWMQAIYYPYSQLTVGMEDEIKVISRHDEYSLWFDVVKANRSDNIEELRPVCECGAHITYSRSRLGMLNDPFRRKTYTELLQKHISAGSEVLCISDGSLLPLLAVRLGAHHVYTIENNNMCCRVVKQFIKHNNLEDKVTVLKKTADNQDLRDTLAKVDLVLGEPVFQTAVLPWDQISYWYTTSHLASCLSSKVKYLPGQMNVYAVAVEYEHLWKIRADVGVCEGFDIREFDNVIQLNSDAVDDAVEPQPLWEYPCTASGPTQCLLSVDFTKHVNETEPVDTSVRLEVVREVPCNGVALWAEFDFGDGHLISTGPTQPVRTGEKILWDYYSRQGVHLFYNNRKHTVESDRDHVVDIKVKFLPHQGQISFKFNPSWLV